VRELIEDLKAVPWRVAVNTLASAPWLPALARVAIYRRAGMDVSWHSVVQPGAYIRAHELTVGHHSTVNYGCVFDNRARVTIGERCGIGMRVQFVTTTHDPSNPAVRAGVGSIAPITVGDGVWIGSGAILLPGIAVGDGCVIAAGAVVKDDCEAHGLYGGVPAKPLRELPTYSRADLAIRD
jgi:maltose O-acetyltransferase